MSNSNFNNILQPINTIPLSDANYGTALNDRLTKIQENFEDIIQSEYLKGSPGNNTVTKSVILTNSNDVVGVYLNSNSQTQITKGYLFTSIENAIKSKWGINTNEPSLSNCGGKSWNGDLINKEIILITEQVSDRLILKSIVPFTHIDLRFYNSNISENPSSYKDLIDTSCSIHYDTGNGFIALSSFPTLYYDSNVGTGNICWKINGQETGMVAQGPMGKDADPFISYLCKGEMGVDADANNIIKITDKWGLNADGYYDWLQISGKDNLQEHSQCFVIVQPDSTTNQHDLYIVYPIWNENGWFEGTADIGIQNNWSDAQFEQCMLNLGQNGAAEGIIIPDKDEMGKHIFSSNDPDNPQHITLKHQYNNDTNGEVEEDEANLRIKGNLKLDNNLDVSGSSYLKDLKLNEISGNDSPSIILNAKNINCPNGLIINSNEIELGQESSDQQTIIYGPIHLVSKNDYAHYISGPISHNGTFSGKDLIISKQFYGANDEDMIKIMTEKIIDLQSGNEESGGQTISEQIKRKIVDLGLNIQENAEQSIRRYIPTEKKGINPELTSNENSNNHRKVVYNPESEEYSPNSANLNTWKWGIIGTDNNGNIILVDQKYYTDDDEDYSFSKINTLNNLLNDPLVLVRKESTKHELKHTTSICNCEYDLDIPLMSSNINNDIFEIHINKTPILICSASGQSRKGAGAQPYGCTIEAEQNYKIKILGKIGDGEDVVNLNDYYNQFKLEINDWDAASGRFIISNPKIEENSETIQVSKTVSLTANTDGFANADSNKYGANIITCGALPIRSCKISLNNDMSFPTNVTITKIQVECEISYGFESRINDNTSYKDLYESSIICIASASIPISKMNNIYIHNLYKNSIKGYSLKLFRDEIKYQSTDSPYSGANNIKTPIFDRPIDDYMNIKIDEIYDIDDQYINIETLNQTYFYLTQPDRTKISWWYKAIQVDKCKHYIFLDGNMYIRNNNIFGEVTTGVDHLFYKGKIEGDNINIDTKNMWDAIISESSTEASINVDE